MRLITLGAACLNQTPLDWDGNHRRIAAAIDDARDHGVGLLCLPELCVTGYGCEDMFFSAGVQQTALDQLDALAPQTEGIAVAVGLPAFHESALYNTAALLADGELLGIVGKQFMASDGLHYEPRWFRRWPEGVVGQIEVGKRDYPIGDLLFDLGGIRVGFEICRDAWVANRPGGGLARRGADVLLNPSASHFAFGKQETRKRIVLEGSRAFCSSFVYCNLLGNESGRAIYDGGAMIASGGQLLAHGRRFSYADHDLVVATVDVAQTRRARAQSFDNGQAIAEDLPPIAADYAWPPAATSAATTPMKAPAAAWEKGDRVKEEEFTRAVALGLLDYLRKSHGRGFVVSLSGGADSSAVAVLIAMMARLGAEELGIPALVQRLGVAGEALGSADQVAQVVQGLLTCVYQSTRNSSETTLHAAQEVSGAIGAEMLRWDVDGLVEGYVRTVSEATGKSLSWDTDDLALQNIQARARGPAAWLLANLRGALLLSTSNRSEAAVGYATMDGDTCGGLSPIAGIDKAFLRQWLRWMETEGPLGIGALPELAVVNNQQPTAELRPPAEGQTDEADLMPYPVLDAIERCAVRDKRLPQDAYAVIRGQFPEYDAPQIATWIERFYTLWRQNQWKRERYAPSFHLDDENLDPKSWCRFPILSNAYERELREMRAD